jgi:hypothetical protein
MLTVFPRAPRGGTPRRAPPLQGAGRFSSNRPARSGAQSNKTHSRQITRNGPTIENGSACILVAVPPVTSGWQSPWNWRRAQYRRVRVAVLVVEAVVRVAALGVLASRSLRLPMGSANAVRNVGSARGACRVRVARYDGSVSWLDSVVAETIADRIFASAMGGSDEDADDALPMPPGRYFARKAFNDVESEAKLVEALNERCAGRAFIEGDDLATLVSLQRLAQTAWIHYGHARSAAAGAEGDHFFGPLAQRAVRRAHQAALAIRRTAARAVTRAAIHARHASRAGSTAPVRLRLVRRQAGLSSRLRAPARRRVRVAAVAGVGSGSEEPGPEPSRSRSAVRFPARRRS